MLRSFLCLVLFAPAMALAWGPQGHRSVGALADAMLAGSPAMQRVQSILRPGETLELVSVWADCARSVGVKKSKFVFAPNDKDYPDCTRFDADGDEFIRYVAANWTQCGLPNGSEYCHHQYHYADVAIQRAVYQQGYAGTSDHDIVAAINACIAMLLDKPVPAPFHFADKRIALMLLVHFIGDIHQPLHVGAIYLDEDADRIDPDAGAFLASTETAGGNYLLDAGSLFHPTPTRNPPYNLHSEWDAIPADLASNGARWPDLLNQSRAVSQDAGEISTWAGLWATEALAPARAAFAPLTFEWTKNRQVPRWNITGITKDYADEAERAQQQQLARAGARLARVLSAVFGG